MDTAETPKWKGVDPVVWLLFAGIVFSTGALIAVCLMFKDDGQVFQVIAAMLTGFSTALFSRTRSAAARPGQGPPEPTTPADVTK